MQVNSVGWINARALIRFVFRLHAGLPRSSPSSSFPLPIALIGAMKRIVVCPLLFSMMLIAGCSKSDFPRGKYPVVDSGVWVADVDNEAFVWLDDRRIAFISSPSFRHSADTSQHTLVIWKVGEKPRLFRERVTGLRCFDNKELGYWRFNRLQPAEAFKGPLGKEQLWNNRACKRYRPNFVLPLIGTGCECLDDSKEPWVTRNAFPLQTGHGWIDLGADRKSVDTLDNLPVTYHQDVGGGAYAVQISRTDRDIVSPIQRRVLY